MTDWYAREFLNTATFQYLNAYGVWIISGDEIGYHPSTPPNAVYSRSRR
jgi:hypothetical protein